MVSGNFKILRDCAKTTTKIFHTVYEPEVVIVC